MSSENFDKKLNVVASLCDTCDCGCPTLIESQDGETIILVGALDEDVLNNPVVKRKISEGETAVSVPRVFFEDAIRALSSK